MSTVAAYFPAAPLPAVEAAAESASEAVVNAATKADKSSSSRKIGTAIVLCGLAAAAFRYKKGLRRAALEFSQATRERVKGTPMEKGMDAAGAKLSELAAAAGSALETFANSPQVADAATKLSTLRASASAALAPLAEETRRSLKFACDAAMEAASPAVERAAAALAAASPSASKNRLDALEAQVAALAAASAAPLVAPVAVAEPPSAPQPAPEPVSEPAPEPVVVSKKKGKKSSAPAEPVASDADAAAN